MELYKSKVLVDDDIENMKETHGVLMNGILKVLCAKDLDANRRSVIVLEEFGYNKEKIVLLGELCVCLCVVCVCVCMCVCVRARVCV